MSGDDPRCPRCGGAFRCGANDPGPCACTRIALDGATLAALRQRYDGCLCVACLAALSGPSQPATTEPTNAPTH